MKRSYVFAATLLMTIGMLSCSEEVKTLEDEVAEIKQENEQELMEAEEEIEAKAELADHIKGSWEKIAQDCDAEGNNCKETKGSDWVFDGKQVILGRVQQPYTVSNDTIYIADSPYRIAMEWGDTILMHGIATDRYMKLVRK